MREKFDTSGFMAWLKEEFPGCVDTQWNYELVENVIDYGLEHKESMENFCSWLCDMLPEIEISEIEQFVS